MSLPRQTNPIDDMDGLLNRLQDFELLFQKTHNRFDPAFQQEYRLFRQYIQWRVEDFNKAMREELNENIIGLSHQLRP